MVDASVIKRNLEQIKGRVSQAAVKSGRSSDDVTIVAVCKYVDSNVTARVVGAGALDIGENRPQQLWNKTEVIVDSDIRWHLIGQLQTNKVKRTLPLVSLVHSVDRLKLVRSIQQYFEQTGESTDCLLQVNISGDSAKSGFKPDDVETALLEIAKCSGVRVKGLMAMAGLESDSNTARREFNSLRILRDKLQNDLGDAVDLSELSMGMSRDYEAAIEEGATIVRIGSSIFQE